MNLTLTNETFELFAAKCYKKRFCFSTKSFLNDLNTLEVKKDLTRYFNTDEERLIRLIINKSIIAINLFGTDAIEMMLFKLLPDENYILFMKHIFHLLNLIKTDFEVDEELLRKINEALSKT